MDSFEIFGGGSSRYNLEVRIIGHKFSKCLEAVPALVWGSFGCSKPMNGQISCNEVGRDLYFQHIHH